MLACMNLLGWAAGTAAIAVFTATVVATPTAPPAGPGAPTTLRALYGLEAPRAWKASATALVLVDFQEEFVSGKLPVARGEPAIARAKELVDWARASGVAIAHVKNVAAKPTSPVFAPGSKGAEPLAGFDPRAGEIAVTKSTGGGFTRTELDAALRARGIDTIVVAGFMTHLAVEQTARDAALLGYRVVVARDATATRDLLRADGQGMLAADAVHEVSLASLADRFADPMTTRAIRDLPLAR